MKLEKFDYQIGNKKAKQQFIVLGGLCIALIVTVVLYKTFAKFSSSVSYNIVSSEVGDIGNNRIEVVRVDISKTGEQNEVYAVLYDDNSLVIEGSGYMKDFSDTDIIGEVLEEYIENNKQTLFTESELAFIANNENKMMSIFNIAGRSSFISKNDIDFTNKIGDLFKDENDDPITEDIEKAIAIKNKVVASGFDIDSIEIIGNVKNIGDNAFNLKGAIAAGNNRYDLYTYDSIDYKGEDNLYQTFNSITLNADLEEVGNPQTASSAVSDLYIQNIIIEEGVTTIPNDIFAWYGDKLKTSERVDMNNQVISLPTSVTKIGNSAFYLYEGSLVLPSNITEIEEYSFASYNKGNLVFPVSLTTIKENAFRDFNKRIDMNSCPQNKIFAPNATIYSGGEECLFE